MAAYDISSLVKFCDMATGLKILNSQSLRWSSPHLYNDPFELNHNSKPNFNQQSLTAGIVKEAISMLFGPKEPTGKKNQLIAAISRWREEERFTSEEEAEEVLKQLLGQVAEQQQQAIDAYLLSWKAFANKHRICCFSDKPTNMQAWQRFGDNHSGIALRFSCGNGTTLTNPQRVKYSTKPAQITSLKEQVSICYNHQEPISTDGFLEKLLSKNKANSVEREWRCFEVERNRLDSDDQLWYINKKFSSPELKAVYLGLATTAQNKKAIAALIKSKYKKTKLYQAKALPGRYEIDFHLVGTH